jgi:hypothetical protein
MAAAWKGVGPNECVVGQGMLPSDSNDDEQS